MNGKQARSLRNLVKAQFEGKVNPSVIKKVYKRTKIAWIKTPRNQRAQLKKWLDQTQNLYKTINQNNK